MYIFKLLRSINDQFVIPAVQTMGDVSSFMFTSYKWINNFWLTIYIMLHDAYICLNKIEIKLTIKVSHKFD